MANIFQSVLQKVKDIALGAYHQVNRNDNGQTFGGYLDDEKKRRLQQQIASSQNARNNQQVNVPQPGQPQRPAARLNVNRSDQFGLTGDPLDNKLQVKGQQQAQIKPPVVPTPGVPTPQPKPQQQAQKQPQNVDKRNLFQKVWDQVNIGDSTRTFKDATPDVAPTIKIQDFTDPSKMGGAPKLDQAGKFRIPSISGSTKQISGEAYTTPQGLVDSFRTFRKDIKRSYVQQTLDRAREGDEVSINALRVLGQNNLLDEDATGISSNPLINAVRAAGGGLEQGTAQIARGFQKAPLLGSITNAILKVGNGDQSEEAANDAINKFRQAGEFNRSVSSPTGAGSILNTAGNTVPTLAASYINPTIGISAGYGQSAGSTYDQAIAMGATDEEAKRAAVIGGIPGGVLSYLGARGTLNPEALASGSLSRIAARGTGDAAEQMASRGFGSQFIRDRILQAPIEAVTGAGQQIATNYGLQKGGRDVDLFDNVGQAVKDNLVSAEALGGGIDLVGGARGRFRRADPNAPVRIGEQAGRVDPETGIRLMEEEQAQRAQERQYKPDTEELIAQVREQMPEIEVPRGLTEPEVIEHINREVAKQMGVVDTPEVETQDKVLGGTVGRDAVSPLDDPALRVPRSDAQPFTGEFDPITKVKIDQLIKSAEIEPRPEGTRRMFQAVGGDGQTKYFFDDVDKLAAFKNNTSADSDNFRFVDVPEGSVQEVPGKPGVYSVDESSIVPEAAKQTPIEEQINQAPEDVIDPANKAVENTGEGVPFRDSVSHEDLNPISKSFVEEYATMLQDIEKGAKGGQMIDTTGETEAYGSGRRRISEHSPFYREYFAENGRAPSKAAYVEEAYRQLKEGRADPYAQNEFAILDRDVNDPELRSLYESANRQGTPENNPEGSLDGIDIGNLQRLEIAPKPMFNVDDTRGNTKEPGVRLGGFAESVKNSDEVSSDVKSDIGATVKTKSNKDLTANAEQLIADGDMVGATREVYGALSKKLGEINDQDVANTIQVAKALDAEGNFDQASEMYDQLSAHLTEAGRTVQAASLLNSRTPEGIQAAAQRVFKKAEIELTPEIKAQLKDHMAKIKATEPNTRERDMAVHELNQMVAKEIPTGKMKKLVTVWKAGLLTSPTTTAGNILSNTVESTTKKLLVDPLAAAVDKAFSVVTGKRSKTFTLKGIGEGVKEGGAKGKEYFKSGFDERKSITKYDMKGDVNFGKSSGGKLLQAYTDTVFRFLGAQDQPFYYANLRNSLHDQALAAVKNEGVRGAAKSKFISDFMENPPTKAAQVASNDAARAVFGNDTWLSKKAGALRQGEGGAAVEVIMPFTGVPSSVATRILERTPVGAFKEVISQMRSKKFDQRALSEAISNSAIGTGGALMLGSALVKNNMITLQFPQDDKERKLWEQEGKQPYSIHIGDKWYSLNYVQPFGSILAAGAQYAQSRKDGESIPSAMAAATAQAGKSVTGQSFLQGVSGALEAVQDPSKSAEKFASSTVGSIVPNIVKRVASATDSVQRDTKGIINNLKGGIPGVRQTLDPKLDSLGNELPRASSGFDTMFNPLKPSKARGDNLTAELRRLQDVKEGVMPSDVDAKIKFDGVEAKLSKQQQAEIKKNAGQATQEGWKRLIETQEYKDLTDEEKKNALSNVASDMAAVAREDFAAKNKLGQYADGFSGTAKPLSSRQDSIMNGQFDPTNYASGTKTKLVAGISSTAKKTISDVDAMPSEKREKYLKDQKNKYQYNLAKFENDLKGDKLSDVEKYKRLRELGKDRVRSNYSSEVIEMYGLSKAGLRAFNEGKPISKEDQAALIKLDQEMYNGGFASSLKYKKGLLGGSGGSGGGKGGGRGGKEKKIPIPAPKFGSFKLVAPPNVPQADLNQVIADFKKQVGDIKILQGTQIAPGQDSSEIKIAV